MSPDMTRMGETLASASDLLMSHEDVLRKLQSKQSPVEELLKQADQLIASQRPRAEVYAAMAESLGQAWKDLNAFLEQRRVILEFNVAFHSHGEDVLEKLATLDRESLNATLPTDIESIKRLSCRLEDIRRSALESHRLALQDGQALIEQLTVLKNRGSLDSRPDHILPSVKLALGQVERWLEALHDRRRRTEILYQKRKIILEQWLTISALKKELEIIDKKIETLREELMRNNALGDSCATSELYLFEHNKFQPKFKDLQEKTIKLAHHSEDLLLKKYFASEQAHAEAYTLLEKCNDYVDLVEQRTQLLSMSIQFFRVAQTATNKLDQLEVQLTAHQIPAGSPQLAQLHAQVSRALEDSTAPALHHGYSLLERVGLGNPDAEAGVRRTVEMIENRAIQLGSMCTAHKEESLRITQAVISFLERYDMLYSWLLNIADAFLKGHQDMGGTLAESMDVLEMHKQLESDFNAKGAEIEAVLRSANPLCEMAEEAQAHEVQMKADHLQDLWQHIRRVLFERIELMHSYVRVHTLALQVSECFDDLETKVTDMPTANENDALKQVEECWLNAKQKYLQFENIGRNFISDAVKTSDRHLDVRKACLCIESLLEYFGSRQLSIHQMRETWITTVTALRETHTQWIQFMSGIHKMVQIHEEKGNNVFPILPTEKLSPLVMISTLDDKLMKATVDITAALYDYDMRRQEAERIKLNDSYFEQQSNVVSDLISCQRRLNLNLNNLRTLIPMQIAFFKYIAEMDHLLESMKQKKSTYVLNTVADVEQALKEHSVLKTSVDELRHLARNCASELITTILKMESEDHWRSEMEVIESYISSREQQLETEWTKQCEDLNKQKQRCQFNGDLHQINVQLDDLSRQLLAMKGQYGNSSKMAIVTSQAFFQFEKTIELLELRVSTFVSTANKMINEEDNDRPYIEEEVKQIQSKWSSFHCQVGETRQLINLSIEYFTLVEEVEECLREGSKLLVTIARKSTSAKTPSEAQSLLKQVDNFIKPREAIQEEKIRKISQLAIQLYGPECAKHIDPVLEENRNMLDSF